MRRRSGIKPVGDEFGICAEIERVLWGAVPVVAETEKAMPVPDKLLGQCPCDPGKGGREVAVRHDDGIADLGDA